MPWGWGEAQLAAINPRLILVQLDAFGGPARGPKSDHLGYDDLAQAATGVMVRFGGGMQTPEEHAHFGTIDVLTGFCACVALGAALLRLEKTGKGGIARAALAGAGNLIQAQLMYDFEGRAPFDEPSGREALGWGPFYHCYRAADGWMFFAAPSEERGALTRVPELADLAKVYQTLTWLRRFQTGSQPATLPIGRRPLPEALPPSCPWGRCMRPAMRFCSPRATGQIDLAGNTFSVIRHDQHPMGRWCDLVAPNAVRPERASISIPGPMPKYGADTHRILGEIGFSRAQIETMIATGAASDSWSNKYLPE